MVFTELFMVKIKVLRHLAMENAADGIAVLEEQDAIDSYFECITACSLKGDSVECLTRCVEIHLKKEV